MKKIGLTLLLMFSLINFLFGSSRFQNEFDHLKLKGNVKTMKLFTYENLNDPNDIAKNKPTGIGVLHLNPTGQLTEKMKYNADEVLLSRNEYRYDPSNRIIEEIEYDANGSILEKNTYSYNNFGKLKERRRTFLQGPDHVVKYKYDSKNNLIEELNENNSGLIRKQGYQYKNGQMITGITEEFHSGENTDPEPTTFTFEYNGNGNRIKKSHFDIDQVLTFEEKYDAKGDLTDFIWYEPDGKVSMKQIFTYDEQGNQISFISYEENEKIEFSSSCSYEYDVNNNWIKKWLFSDDKISTIYTREIEYYKD